MSNMESQLDQMRELATLNEAKERKAQTKMKRMQEAILKVGTLQEKSNENNQKQCDYITELLKQVDLLKSKLSESDEARTILDTLCKEQEHQLLTHRKENMLRAIEEEKNFNQEMVRRIADMEAQNDYLQRKLADNCTVFKNKDSEIEQLQSQLKVLRIDNQELKKKLNQYQDAYQSYETHSLIQECRNNSKRRQINQAKQQEEEKTYK